MNDKIAKFMTDHKKSQIRFYTYLYLRLKKVILVSIVNLVQNVWFLDSVNNFQ